MAIAQHTYRIDTNGKEQWPVKSSNAESAAWTAAAQHPRAAYVVAENQDDPGDRHLLHR